MAGSFGNRFSPETTESMMASRLDAKISLRKQLNRAETVNTAVESSSSTYSEDEGLTDADIIAQAEFLLEEERLLHAASKLRRVEDTSLLKEKHREALRLAEDCEEAVADLQNEPDSSWIKQGESHGKRDTLIYYKVDENARLTCRIETPIEASLLVPLLAVLNEVDLYETWIPSWSLPRLGVRKSQQLEQKSRGNQILQVTCDVPWPCCGREVVMQALAIDDIDTNSFVAVRMKTLKEGDAVVPPPESNTERIDFEGAMLFRACPPDHPILLKSRKRYQEPLILVSFKMFVDPKMSAVPTSLINFVTRTVIGHMWSMLLQVADDIKTGRRLRHKAVIDSKRNFYAWVESRIQVMFDKLQEVSIELEEQRFISYLQG